MSLFSVFSLPSAKQHQKAFLCRYILLKIHNNKDKEKNHKSREEENKLPAREWARLICDFSLLTMDAKENGATFSKFFQ